MSYISDRDLEFLKFCSKEHLKILYTLLTKKTGHDKKYAASRLHEKDRLDWRRLAEELQLFGGHTAANVVRRHGVKYREILDDILSRCEICNPLMTAIKANPPKADLFTSNESLFKAVTYSVIPKENALISHFFAGKSFDQIFSSMQQWDPNIAYNSYSKEASAILVTLGKILSKRALPKMPISRSADLFFNIGTFATILASVTAPKVLRRPAIAVKVSPY